MNYFELLNLHREPFSPLPAPEELFFASKQHQECLRSLEIGIWLRRGLHVVTGNVGTGKTTLVGKLLRTLQDRPDSWTHMIADPFFKDRGEFLMYLNKSFGVSPARSTAVSQWQLRENLRDVLTQMVEEDGRVVTLIVDEGQKLSPECLEVLRDLLNFELNEHNLLQIVIFGQLEFADLLVSQANIFDRVNRHLRLGPMGFDEMCELIKTRIVKCAKDTPPKGLFSFGSLVAIYLATDGYPRKVMQLCHQSILSITLKGQSRVTWQTVRRCARWRELVKTKRGRWSWMTGFVLTILLGLAAWGIGSRLNFTAMEMPAFVSRLLSGVSSVLAPVAPVPSSSAPAPTTPAPALAPATPPRQTPDALPAARPEPPVAAAAQEAKPAPALSKHTNQPPAAPSAPTALPPAAVQEAPHASTPEKAPTAITAPSSVPQKPSDASAPTPAASVRGPATASTQPETVPVDDRAPTAVLPAPPDATAPAVTSESAPDSAQTPPPAAMAKHAPAPAATDTLPTDARVPVADNSQPALQTPHETVQAPPQTESTRENADPQFLGVNLLEEDDHTVVDLFTDTPVDNVKTSFSINPPRFFVDLMGQWQRQGARDVRVTSPRVEKIRCTQLPGKLRVEIFLTNPSERPRIPTAETTPNGLRLKIK